MTRHAKASSAGSNSGNGNSRALFGRGAATRGASRDGEGSGAPSIKLAKAPVLFGLITLLVLTIGVSIAIAAKKVDSFVGSPTGATGATAGLFNTPRGIAVNNAGTGGALAGDYYVADSSHNRIQQFRANGTFVRAFGQDVVAAGSPDNANEVQWATVNAAAGTFRLTFGATGTNTTGATGTGDVAELSTTVSNVVTSTGAFVQGEAITGAGIPAGTTIAAVGAGTITLSQQATATNSGTALTADLPYNASASVVQNALNALTTISTGGGSVAVSGGPGDGTGSSPYVVTFNGGPLKGTDVAAMIAANGFLALSGGSGVGANEAKIVTANTGNTGYEICDALANPTDVCKAGVSTGGLGGTLSSPQGVAIDQATGAVYVTDQGNRRVQKFSAGGAWLRAFGQDVVSPGGAGDVLLPANEKQTVTLSNGFGWPSGTFTLTFNGQTTGAIDANASAAAMDAALEALSTVGAGNVNVTGGGGATWMFEFVGALSNTDAPLMIGNNANLEFGFGSITIATVQPGGPAAPAFSEVCTVSWQCKAAGAAWDNAGVFGSTLGYPAVDSSGNVYVPDTSNQRIQKFDSSGNFVTTWGWDVIPSGKPGDTGAGLEACPASSATTAGACRAGAGGSGAGQLNAPSRVAVDSTGKVYVLDGNPRVQTFTSSGGSPGTFAEADLSGSPAPTNIAIGAGNQVFVAKPCTAALCPGAAVTTEQRIKELTPAGTLQDTHMVGAGFTTVNGLAVNPTSGNLHVTTSGGTPGSRAWTLDNDGAQPASIASVSPASEVTEHTATLNGVVTPNGPTGFATSYHFEYSRNGVTWTPVAADVNLGEGTSPINLPVSLAQGAVTGLEANTFYRARVVATKAFGAGTVTSAEVTFVTDGVKPEVTTSYPLDITDTTATLRALLNPNNLPTTYHFEYGKTTAYGSNAPIPDGNASGGATKAVLVDVSDLEPGATYHVRLVATNSEGTTNGSDVTFTTRPLGAATRPARAYEMVTPPFKVTRSTAAVASSVRNNPNTGVPSLSGDSFAWTKSFFPLTEDVGAPGDGDNRVFDRSGAGWVGHTMNTLGAIVKPDGSTHAPSFTRQNAIASTGDLKTVAWRMPAGADAELIPTPGVFASRNYTRRDGTGVEGFTSWLDVPQLQQTIKGDELSDAQDQAIFNDSGTAMVRWGGYRDLAENFSTPTDEDPSSQQNSSSTDLNQSIYLQRTEDPDQLPGSYRELVNECTGTVGGGTATVIPARVGTGSAATDTIGTQACAEAGTPEAVGTATRTQGSATLTGVSASSGAFAVGQFLSGDGIARGTTVTAVGPGTLTLSSAVTCGAAGGQGAVTVNSPVVTNVLASCGTFEVGQTLTGEGIPGGTTILGVGPGNRLTLSANATEPRPKSSLSVNGSASTTVVADAQHVTNVRGGTVGGDGADSGGSGSTATYGPATTAMSNDGNRVFFQSPSWRATGVATTNCASGATAVGTGTSCPPQLFVRQYDSDGDPIVRWISRAQGVGTQQIGEIGSGAGFQGASRDGRYVYFKTNAPLTPDDPNGGNSSTTATASTSSFDLYRYELPASRDDDPGSGALTRITGGPLGQAVGSGNLTSGQPTVSGLTTSSGTFAVGQLIRGTGIPAGTTISAVGAGSLTLSQNANAPGTAVALNAAADPAATLTNGTGAPMRFLSDDGKRAYFVTTSPIAGADSTPPKGGVTSPGGTVANSTTRDLYLFDDNREGAAKWQFVAQLPFDTGGSFSENKLNACATYRSKLLYPTNSQFGATRVYEGGSCFRGTRDGKAVIFITRGQLVPSDTDNVFDIYLYNAERDELVRVTAPTPTSQPYGCLQKGFKPAEIESYCYGDYGSLGAWGAGGGSAAGAMEFQRGWGGGRYGNVAMDGEGNVSVFFESQSQLVSDDTNGDYYDVYQWKEGKLSLVTPGNSKDDAWFSGNSVDGRDVFFYTSQRIDPREIDDQDLDIYDARVGGGFPYTPPATTCDVLANQCRDAALPSPAVTPAATSGFSGSGNVTKAPRKRCGKGKVRRGNGCVRKHQGKQRRNANRTGRAGR